MALMALFMVTPLPTTNIRTLFLVATVVVVVVVVLVAVVAVVVAPT